MALRHCITPSCVYYNLAILSLLLVAMSIVDHSGGAGGGALGPWCPSVAVSAASSPPDLYNSTCQECVEFGCVYCKGVLNPALQSSTLCVCAWQFATERIARTGNTSTDAAANCNDAVAFGFQDAMTAQDATVSNISPLQLNSNTDCTFQSSRGELIAAMIPVSVIAFLIGSYAAYYFYKKKKANENAKDSSSSMNQVATA